MNVTDAAQRVGVSEGRIRQMIGAGICRAVKRGRGWDVSPAEVERQIRLRREGGIKVGRESDLGEVDDELATFTLDEIGVKPEELMDFLLVLHKFGWRYWSHATFDVAAPVGREIKAELAKFVREARRAQDVQFLGAALFAPQRPMSHTLPVIEKLGKKKGRGKELKFEQKTLDV